MKFVLVVALCCLLCDLAVSSKWCPRHESYVESSECEESCAAFRLQLNCSEARRFTSCFCDAPTHFRHPVTGVCIERACCPPLEEFDYGCVENSICFGKNEEYRVDNPVLELCHVSPLFADLQELHRGCFCKKGYFRNGKGECVVYCDTPEIDDDFPEDLPCDADFEKQFTVTSFDAKSNYKNLHY